MTPGDEIWNWCDTPFSPHFFPKQLITTSYLKKTYTSFLCFETFQHFFGKIFFGKTFGVEPSLFWEQLGSGSWAYSVHSDLARLCPLVGSGMDHPFQAILWEWVFDFLGILQKMVKALRLVRIRITDRVKWKDFVTNLLHKFVTFHFTGWLHSLKLT